MPSAETKHILVLYIGLFADVRTCARTALLLDELRELLALVLDALLLEVGSDLLHGEVCHVHLENVQHLEDTPVRSQRKDQTM